MGTFVFRWPYPADHVFVTGTFDDWGKSEQLNKVGDVFEKEVTLSSADEKIYYKFVVDDKWIVDEGAPKEDDGHYNVNNVLLPSQIKKLFPTSEVLSDAQNDSANLRSQMNPPRVLATSSAPPGSNSGTSALTEAPTVSAGGEGAPLLSQEQSEGNMARWVPHVTPDPDRPVTRTLPQSDGASASKPEEKRDSGDSDIPGAFPETPAVENPSFGVAPLPATGHSDVQSSVTTSKEDYERAGGEGAAGGPFTTQPVLEPGQQSLGDSATTSKEDYDKVGASGSDDQQVSVNPLPADGHKDIQSSVTTSKEDYEKVGAFGAAGAAIAGAGAYVASAFSKPKEDDKNIIPESSLPMDSGKTDTLDAGPFISSAGPGTTTAELASQVPLEPKREAQVVPAVDASSAHDPPPFLAAPEAPQVIKDENALPFISSSGPGSTTAALASQVPLETKGQSSVVGDQNVPSEVSAEKSAVEKELLDKVPESQATGTPASAAAAQTSYYGLATAVPEAVEKSISQARASPEAATEPSAVAEKSAVERELQATVPVVDTAGEPAPALSAATSTTAPTATAVAGGDLTDGKTANQPVPGTDTSTQADGVSAGELAGGAAVGGAAAAGAAALAAKHEDRDVEPPRVADAQKPAVTTEAVPNGQAGDKLSAPVAGIGAASPQPGVSPIAGAALSDGTEGSDEPSAIKNKAPVETSEATATEYAPPRAGGIAPGVSPMAAAALSDGTEDPTLSEEPAVKMMKQNETGTEATTGAAPVHQATTVGDSSSTAADVKKDDVATKSSAPESSTIAAAKTSQPETPKKTAAAATGSSASTPVRGTPESSTTGDKKKKRHRLSAMIKKIFD